MVWTSASRFREYKENTFCAPIRAQFHTSNFIFSVTDGVSFNHLWKYESTMSTEHNHVQPTYQTSRLWRLVRNVPDKNGFPYANVLALFGETSQTTRKEVNVKVWMSPLQLSEQDEPSSAFWTGQHKQRQSRVHVRTEFYSLLLPEFFFISFLSNFAHS